MDLKENVKKAIESNEPDPGKINTILLKLLIYFRKIYGNGKTNAKNKP